MKVSKRISLVMAVIVFLSGCAEPKQTSKPTKKEPLMKETPQFAQESTGAEHCLKAGDRSYCFLEVDGEESIDFYATGEAYDKLLLDPILTEIQIQLKPLDTANYEKKKKGVLTKLEYEGAQSNGVHVYTNKMDEDAMFTDVMFRVISFLWKAAKNYNKEEPKGLIEKLKNKLSYYKDKLGNKLSSMFGRGGVDSSAETAAGLKARITWHYGTAILTKDLVIPPEYFETPAEKEPAGGEAAPASMTMDPAKK